jgi:predicted GNAT family acetyltransferase
MQGVQVSRAKVRNVWTFAITRAHLATNWKSIEDVAVATYRLKRNVITFIHTEVPPDIRRQGIAARLIAGALADVRAHGWKFRTMCPFVTSYVERHPEVRDLLAGGDA